MAKAVIPENRPDCDHLDCTYVQHVGKHSFENVNIHMNKDGSMRVVVQEPKLARRFRVPKGLRRQVIARDGPICRYCGALLIFIHTLITIDHVIPQSLGGENSFENLVVSCSPCNTAKGNRSLEEAGMTLFPLGFFNENLRKVNRFRSLNRTGIKKNFVELIEDKEYS